MEQDTATVNDPAVCSNCNSDDRWILHHVFHRKTFRRLCTTCVLKLHSASFCIICFSLHDRPQKQASSMAIDPSPSGPRAILVCLKCHSNSHATCVSPNTPKSPYLCPTCSTPGLKLFDLRKPSKSGDAGNQAIDLKSSKVFLAAATIAMNSMNEVKERLRVEAEKKAKESLAAIKNAKADLDHVALVWMREQARAIPKEGNGEALVASVNGLAIKVQSSGVAQMDTRGGTVLAGVKKEGDRAFVVSGRPLMAGTTVIMNSSNGLQSCNSHDKR